MLACCIVAIFNLVYLFYTCDMISIVIIYICMHSFVYKPVHTVCVHVICPSVASLILDSSGWFVCCEGCVQQALHSLWQSLSGFVCGVGCVQHLSYFVPSQLNLCL